MTSATGDKNLEEEAPRVTPIKRRRLLNLVDLRSPSGEMAGSSAEVGIISSIPTFVSTGVSSVGHPRRPRAPLSNLEDKFVTKSGICLTGEPTEACHRGGSVRLPSHLASELSRSLSVGDESRPRFPRLDQCAHFHYEYVELPPLQVTLVSEDLKPLSTHEDSENRSLLVQVTSHSRSWVVRRTFENFRLLDRQLHRCCYDRKYSQLQELPPEENLGGDDREVAVECILTDYLIRLSEIAGSLITCGPVLNWLELDNRGHRLIVTDDSDINTPAVAAAYVRKRYTAQASDELSFEVGDMISVIDMPPPEESIWWRGKRGFQVGFFPCECVQVIGDKVPQAIHPQELTFPSSVKSGVHPPLHSHLVARTSSSSNQAQAPTKPVLRKHGKLIAFFRSFILSRPSRRKLKQSGILKERVFGCDLGEHLLNSGHEIPMVLKCCSEFLESHGIADGIYRLSGITSNIQKLRNAFDEDRVPDLYGDENIRQDIHCVSSVLKMYFRELPNPLLTYQLYDKFVNAVMQDEDMRLLCVRDVVQQLPPPHYRTLEYLIRHLSRVASHSSTTAMTPKNIAIVWAPNLLRSKELDMGGVTALQDVGTQAVVTEYLIRYVDLIFSDKIPSFLLSSSPNDGTPRRLRPKSLAISTPTKLISIEEARSRARNSAIKPDQHYIEVGGGPQNLPLKYHTVIEFPGRKGGSFKHKKSPVGWKSFFSKSRSVKSHRKTSTPTDVNLNMSDSAVLEVKTSAKTRKLRPVKSVESLISSSLHSNRSSQAFDGHLPMHTEDKVEKLHSGRSRESSPLPSPKSHNRSVSHDSYFNLLERNGSTSPAYGALPETGESDSDASPKNSKLFLDVSELNLEFQFSEPEMKLFSEDETLRSTSLEDGLCSEESSLTENKSPKQEKSNLKCKSKSKSPISLEKSNINDCTTISDRNNMEISVPETSLSSLPHHEHVKSHMETVSDELNSSQKDVLCKEVNKDNMDRSTYQSSLIEPELLYRIAQMGNTSSANINTLPVLCSASGSPTSVISETFQTALDESMLLSNLVKDAEVSVEQETCNGDYFQAEIDKNRHSRPSSLLGLPSGDYLSVGSSQTSPETPQGDSTFLDIQYHPLSDTTEPSTPSESPYVPQSPPSNFNSTRLDSSITKTSPLSSDVCTSDEEPLNISPIYEDDISPSTPTLTQNAESVSSTGIFDAPENDVCYENVSVEGGHISDIVYENFEYNSAYENVFVLDNTVPSDNDSQDYENVNISSYDQGNNLSCGPVEQSQCSVNDDGGESPDVSQYENVQFSSAKTLTCLEENEVYQKVKFLRESVKEVNELVKVHNCNNDIFPDEKLQLALPVTVPTDICELSKSNEKSFNSSIPASEFMVLSSESLKYVLPSLSFSSGEKLTTTTSAPSSVLCSPVAENDSLLPVAISTPTYSSVYPPLWPRTVSKHSSVGAPIPKPRSLPKLNILPHSSPSISPDSPATPGSSSSSSDAPQVLTPSDESQQLYASQNNTSLFIAEARLKLDTVQANGVSYVRKANVNTQNTNNHGIPKNESNFHLKLHRFNTSHDFRPLNSTKLTEQSQSLPYVDDDCERRERIEKYKDWRRSVLRERFKSESFRNEDDEILQRLRQKATSPSSLTYHKDETAERLKSPRERISPVKDLACSHSQMDEKESNKMININDKQLIVKPSVKSKSTSDCSIDMPTITKSDVLTADSKLEPVLRRANSEDGKSELGVLKSQDGTYRKLSSVFTEGYDSQKMPDNERNSGIHKIQYDSNHKYEADGEVNVKERIAVWSQHVISLVDQPSPAKTETVLVKSPLQGKNPFGVRKLSPSSKGGMFKETVDVANPNTNTVIRGMIGQQKKIKDMAALFEPEPCKTTPLRRLSKEEK